MTEVWPTNTAAPTPQRVPAEPRSLRALPETPSIPAAPPDGDAFPMAHLFRERDPRAILARVTAGDPLGLEVLAAERVRERAYLLDAQRVFQRAQARVAVHGIRYDGDPSIERWSLERVDEAIDALLAADQEDERAQVELVPESDPRFGFLTDALGVAPEDGRAASVRFNGLPFLARHSFFKLCIECVPVDEALACGLGPESVLRERTLRAFFSLGRESRHEDLLEVLAHDGGERR